jgi:transcriptional regulator with XRE-family HTH domain
VAREALPADPTRGSRLRSLREDIEYADLASVAEGTGLSTGGIRKWESGDPIERKSIAALARFYGANPKWIVEGVGPMLRPPEDFLTRLEQLEAEVARQGEALAGLLGPSPLDVPEGERRDASGSGDAAARAGGSYDQDSRRSRS